MKSSRISTEKKVETDCMTVLGWSPDKVAESTLEEMKTQLKTHHSDTKHTNTSLNTPIYTAPRDIFQGVSADRTNGSSIKTNTDLTHAIQNICSIITQKKTAIAMVEKYHVDDIRFLEKSMQTDEDSLTQCLKLLNRKIYTMEEYCSRKKNIRGLLGTITTSTQFHSNPLDVSHLSTIDAQITSCEQELIILRSFLDTPSKR